jgi:hypothetical protein
MASRIAIIGQSTWSLEEKGTTMKKLSRKNYNKFIGFVDRVFTWTDKCELTNSCSFYFIDETDETNNKIVTIERYRSLTLVYLHEKGKCSLKIIRSFSELNQIKKCIVSLG